MDNPETGRVGNLGNGSRYIGGIMSGIVASLFCTLAFALSPFETFIAMISFALLFGILAPGTWNDFWCKLVELIWQI